MKGRISSRKTSFFREELCAHSRPLLAPAATPSLSPHFRRSAHFYTARLSKEKSILNNTLAVNDPAAVTVPSSTSVPLSSSPRRRTSARSANPKEPFPWLKGAVPHGYWDKRENEIRYLNWLGNELGYKSRDDWYAVSSQHFKKNCGSGLLAQYNDSVSRLVSTIYSDHTFLPWKFTRAAKGFFKTRENRIRYVEWLRQKLGLERNEQLESSHFIENHGNGLLKMFEGSPRGVIDSLKSDGGVEAGEDVFNRAFKPSNFWTSMENQRAFLDSVGIKIGVRGHDLSPWYKIGQETLLKLGCGGLLSRSYGLSQYNMLRTVYPEYDWIPWKFKKLPALLKNDPEALEKALRFIESERKIAKSEDWYHVSNEHLRELGVFSFISQLGGLYPTLRTYRSGFDWDERRFMGAQRYFDSPRRDHLQSL